MTLATPPIVKLAFGLLRDIELAVSKFPRCHRYGVGEDLRRAAREVLRVANRAWRDKPQQARWVGQLVWDTDELKFTLQLAKQVHAFHSFAQFEALARCAEELGMQVGGWKKQQHPNGQNSPAQPPAERAETLSTRAASIAEAKS
jgi:hypothetical protein